MYDMPRTNSGRVECDTLESIFGKQVVTLKNALKATITSVTVGSQLKIDILYTPYHTTSSMDVGSRLYWSIELIPVI